MFIDKNIQFERFLKKLSEANSDLICLDTEFIRQDTYWPILCILQIATPTCAVVLDALSLDLSPLIEWFKEQKPLFVCHSPRQDLEILLHDYNFLPHKLFDTQIAAHLLNWADSIGYDSLVQRSLNIPIDKSLQYTDWIQRPLSHAQINYALSDVVHLIPLYQILSSHLKEMNREQWVQDICCHEFLDPSIYEVGPHEAWKKVNLKIIPKRKGKYKWVLLEHLSAWRESEARRLNKNRRAIMSDYDIEMLCVKDKNREEQIALSLSLLKHNNSSINHESFLSIFSQLDELYPLSLPALPSRINTNKSLLTLVIEEKAKELKIHSRYLASKKMIETFCIDALALQKDKLFESPLMNGWRFKVLEKQLRSFLRS